MANYSTVEWQTASKMAPLGSTLSAQQPVAIYLINRVDFDTPLSLNTESEAYVAPNTIRGTVVSQRKDKAIKKWCVLVEFLTDVLPEDTTLISADVGKVERLEGAVAAYLDNSPSKALAFGAKGDGVTDDSVALQAAIDALSATGGGTLKLNRGTYIAAGLVLGDDVYLVGDVKLGTVIKAPNGSNQHVITAGSFDTYANGTSRSTPVGCKSAGLINITIDGNKSNQSSAKHGLAYYGVDLLLENVVVKNCKGSGIYRESPGSAYSTVVGRNLQDNWSKVESYNNDQHGIYYNGQSDSVLNDIMSYANGSGASWADFYIGPKGSGIKVFGFHSWGGSDYGIYCGATYPDFYGAHVESAYSASVYVASGCSIRFDGQVYTNSTITGQAMKAFELAEGVQSCAIRASVRNVASSTGVGALTAITLDGSGDGGANAFELRMYSATGQTSDVLFSGTRSVADRVLALQTGAVTNQIQQFANQLRFDPTFSTYDLWNSGKSWAWFTDAARTYRQFAVEHVAGASNWGWLAMTGGTNGATSGPQMVARGSAENYNVRIVPKGTGKVQFGTHAADETTPAVTGYITVLDAAGNERKLAVID